MIKISQKIILYSFVIWMLSSLSWWLFLFNFGDVNNGKNGDLALEPELTKEYFSNKSKEYDEYFDNNFPLRDNLIAINSAIDFLFFSKSANSKVIIGKDNWLFYNDKEDGDPISCYEGTNLLNEEELEGIAKNCIAQKELLASMGKEFVIFIAPNKERIYSDKMPECYGAPADEYRALQIVQYLRDNTDVRVVYPYQELMAGKNNISEDIWYKTDSHWNMIGGYIGARELLKELGIEVPDICNSDMKILVDDKKTGDLTKMLSVEKFLEKDEDYLILGYDTHNVQKIQDDFDTVIQYKADGADSRKIYVYRDSFCINMAGYIGAQFDESYFRYKRTYSYDDFLEQNSDIFVYETVERYIDNLAYFSID